MRTEIKKAVNGNKYLKINHNNHFIIIYENQKWLIKDILENINVSDPEGIADLEYLESKLTSENFNIFLKCWLNAESEEK